MTTEYLFFLTKFNFYEYLQSLMHQLAVGLRLVLSLLLRRRACECLHCYSL